jgi:hypothetical protein
MAHENPNADQLTTRTSEGDDQRPEPTRRPWSAPAVEVIQEQNMIRSCHYAYYTYTCS